MAEEEKSDKKVAGGTGITAGGNVTFGDISGQVAIGEYINQFKIEPSGEALTKLMDFLEKKRQESFNVEILSKYTPSELPDYPPKLREFVTTNRVDELTKALIYIQDHRILLISGIGGVGKTTLARALVETRPANVPLPFWFDFSKKMDATLGDVLEKLAGYMNAPDIARFRAEKKEAGQEDINRLTDELQKREQLWLVFDNLETILDGTQFHDQGMDLLFTSLRSSTHKAKIIVTSRILPLLKNGESLIDVIEDEKQELKGLKINFAIDYLIKNGLDKVEHEKLEKLAIGVDGHPLALRLLIELVKKFGVADTLNDLSMYQKRKEDTIKKARRLFDKLAGDEKELLERISVFRQPETLNAIKEMFTDKTSEYALEKLIDKSLLETDYKGKYWLHPLVREFAYDDLKNKVEMHKLACQYYLSLPLLPPEKRTKKEDVQPLIEACYHACKAEMYDKAAKIIFKLHEALYKWGNYRELVELYLGVLPKNPFRDKPLLSSEAHRSVLGNLGNACHALGNWEKAIKFYEKALTIEPETIDKKSEGAQLGNIGNVYRVMGEVRKSIKYYEKSLAIAQEIGDKKCEGIWLGALGIDYRLLGEMKNASKYLKRALKIAKETEDRQNESHWLTDIGLVHRDRGEIKKAMEYYKKALKIAQDRRRKGFLLGEFGFAYRYCGEVNEAIEYYEKALKIAREIGDRSNESKWLGYFGEIYHDCGKEEDAVECFKKALKIAQKIGNRRFEGRWFGHLGIVYGALDGARKAIEYYENALKIAQDIGDRQGEGTWLGHLGNAYRALGDVRKAIEYYEKALKIARYIGDKTNKGEWLGNLGNAYNALDDAGKAIEYYEKALKIAQEIGYRRGEGKWLSNLGYVFKNGKKYKEALACCLLAKEIRTQIKDPNLETTESNLKNLKEELGEAEFEKLAAEVAPRAEEIVRKIIEGA